MQRFITGLAFVLGFSVVMALGAGWPTASGRDDRPVDGQESYPQWLVLPGNPSHTQFGRLQPDGTYRGVTSLDEYLSPTSSAPTGNPSHTSFGTPMPDGTYCGVCVPHTDGADDHP